MSIINYSLLMKKKRTRLQNEINRNESIMDEVVSLGLEIERFKDILFDNLMFDYLTLDEEEDYINKMCNSLYSIEESKDRRYEIREFIREQLISMNIKEFEIGCSFLSFNPSNIEGMASGMIRINKRLILSKVESEYPEVYECLRNRAAETIYCILGGII